MAFFERIPADTFERLTMGAGVLLKTFDPSAASITEQTILSNIIAATDGGLSVTATPEFVDFGEGLDNCPTNVLELKKLKSMEVKCTGTGKTIDSDFAKMLLAAADVSGNKITPRLSLADTDFHDLWVVADYGDTDGDYIAVHILNALSTGGFSMQTNNEDKGSFAFEFTGHVSIEAQTTIPIEIYIHRTTSGG